MSNNNTPSNSISNMVGGAKAKRLGARIEQAAYKTTCWAIGATILTAGAAFRAGMGMYRAGTEATKDLVERVGPLLPKLGDEEEVVDAGVEGTVIDQQPVSVDGE